MPITQQSEEYEQLSKLIPLNTLEPDAFNNLLGSIEVMKVNKNQLIFQEGDVDHVNVYLLEGELKLLANNTEIDRVNSTGPASRFPVAHQIPRKYAAKSVGNVTIARIDSRRLSEALAENEKPEIQVETHVQESEDDADWMTQLLQSKVMQHIPAANLQGVMMRMQEMEVEEGDVIINEGDEGDFFYLLHRGEASVLVKDPQTGDNNEVAVLLPGSAFGEDALLSNSPRSSTVKMVTAGVLLKLSKDDFIELIKHPLSAAVSFEQAEQIIADGGVWVDVRDSANYDLEHLPGAINLPHLSLRFQLDSLDADRQYVIYSQSGTRAISSAYLFLERGIQASTLEGGYDAVNQSATSTPAEAEGSNLTAAAASALSTADNQNQIDNSELKALKAQLVQLQQQLADRDTELQSANQQISEMQSNLHAAGEQSIDPKALLQLENKNKKLEREIIGLTEQLESQEDSYETLREQHQRQEQEHKKHLRLRDLEIGEIKEQITVLQLERDEAIADLQMLQNQSNAGVNQSRKSAEVEELEALNASISNERDNQKYEIEDLRNQLSLAKQEVSELQLEISDLKGRLAENSLSTGTNNS